MQLALLGIDDLAWTIIRAIADSPDHLLVTVCDVGDELANVSRLVPQAVREDSWESLVAGRPLDAVIVASGPDAPRRNEQLKRIAQSGTPLLVMHPACDMMQAYELEMIRRETGSVIVPYAPDWSHPAWQRLSAWLRSSAGTEAADGAVEPLEQLILERALTDRSQAAVRKQLSRDELLLRRLLGRVTSVSAAGVAYDEPSFANMSVCFTGPGSAIARWTLAMPAREQISTLTMVSRHGTARLQMPDGGAPWSLEFLDRPGSGETFAEFSPADDALERLQRARDDEPVEPVWVDACLSLETMDGVDRSLRRKRAIDLNTSERSEENSFKGYMAAMGCLMLAAVLLGFFGLAIFEGFRLPMRDSAAPSRSPPESAWPLWLRLWPVYPLAAFLLLQFLVRFTRRPQAG